MFGRQNYQNLGADGALRVEGQHFIYYGIPEVTTRSVCG